MQKRKVDELNLLDDFLFGTMVSYPLFHMKTVQIPFSFTLREQRGIHLKNCASSYIIWNTQKKKMLSMTA